MTLAVARLCARLAAAPPEFLAPLDPKQPGAVRVDAVVADLFRDRASRALAPTEVEAFQFRGQTAYFGVVLIACWLLHDEVFAGMPADTLRTLLGSPLIGLATLVAPRAFVEDPDRREELVRVCLRALALAPTGETVAYAEDRFATLDSVRRDQLLRDSRTRDKEREQRRLELERLRAQEEEEKRKAARTTFED